MRESFPFFRARTRVQVLGKELGIRAKNEMFERWQVKLRRTRFPNACPLSLCDEYPSVGQTSRQADNVHAIIPQGVCTSLPQLFLRAHLSFPCRNVSLVLLVGRVPSPAGSVDRAVACAATLVINTLNNRRYLAISCEVYKLSRQAAQRYVADILGLSSRVFYRSVGMHASSQTVTCNWR